MGNYRIRNLRNTSESTHIKHSRKEVEFFKTFSELKKNV